MTAEAAPGLRWRRWEVACLAAVLLLGLGLRLHGYTQAPLVTDNADELQFAWAGLNLILHGDAYTWSYYPGYASYTVYSAFGTTYPLVHHWMDHPPLFALLVGGWAWLLGDRTLGDVSEGQIRLVALALGAFSAWLSYLLGRRLLGPGPALVGSALLATAPAATLLGRQVEPEALLAPLLAAGLLLALRAAEGRAGPVSLAALLACALAAPLVKVPGLAVAGVCAVVLAVEGRWRLAAATLAAGLAGLGLFAAYGAAVDWRLFVRIWQVQAGNRTGLMSGLDFLTAAAGVNRPLHDGWWLWGWVGVGALGLGGRRQRLYLAWPAVAYAATMLVMAGEAQARQYGWYRWAVFPEIYLVGGWLAWEAVRRRSLPLLALLMVLGGATAANWWVGGLERSWVPDPLLLSVLFLLVLVPAALAQHWPDSPGLRRWTLGAGTALLFACLLGNAVESFFVDRIFTRL